MKRTVALCRRLGRAARQAMARPDDNPLLGGGMEVRRESRFAQQRVMGHSIGAENVETRTRGGDAEEG